MSIYSHPNSIKNIIIALFISCAASFVYAQQPDLDSNVNQGYLESRTIPEKKKDTVIFKGSSAAAGATLSWQEERNLSELQKQARLYRANGLEAQRLGNSDEAMSLYQKAVELDPSYAVAYNDLGIMCEAKGLFERAEESYLQSIRINPNYLSAYSNLALLYENKRDLNKAAYYWNKRVELGLPDDAWTQKAKKRLQDINLVLSNMPIEEVTREQEVVGLLKDVANQKTLLRKDDKELAKNYLEKARQSYNKGDYAAAIKKALDAQHLDPANEEIEAFIEKIQRRALSR